MHGRGQVLQGQFVGGRFCPPPSPEGGRRRAAGGTFAPHVQQCIDRTRTTPNPPRWQPGAPPGSRVAVQTHPTPSVSPPAAHGGAHLLPESFRLPCDPGKPLPVGVMQRMEDLFGSDFAPVRLSRASGPSALGAQAFTVGARIWFAWDLPDLSRPHSLRLLAHELTHVLQQRKGRVVNPYGVGVTVVQHPGLEAEAERMGLRAALEAGRATFSAAAVQESVLQPMKRRRKGSPRKGKKRRRKGLSRVPTSELKSLKITHRSYQSAEHAKHLEERLEAEGKWQKKKQAAAAEEYQKNLEKRGISYTLGEPVPIHFRTNKGVFPNEKSHQLNKGLMAEAYKKYAIEENKGRMFFYVEGLQVGGQVFRQQFLVRRGHDYVVFPLQPDNEVFRQQGQSGPRFSDIAKTADKASKWLHREKKGDFPTLSDARARVGRDVRRMAGGKLPKQEYCLRHMSGNAGLATFAAIIRADKARGIKGGGGGATPYIESILIDGSSSFWKRFATGNPIYMGTGTGGGRGPAFLRDPSEGQGSVSEYSSDEE